MEGEHKSGRSCHYVPHVREPGRWSQRKLASRPPSHENPVRKWHLPDQRVKRLPLSLTEDWLRFRIRGCGRGWGRTPRHLTTGATKALLHQRRRLPSAALGRCVPPEPLPLGRAEPEPGSNCSCVSQRDLKPQHGLLGLELIRTLTFPDCQLNERSGRRAYTSDG